MLNEPSDLGAAGLVAERFAAADAARMAELDRLCKGGKGNETSKQDDQEVRMPACSVCGEAGHNARSCGRRAKEKAEPKAEPEKAKAPRRPAPSLVRVASHKLFDTKEATVEQLVDTIAACRAELEERQEQLRAQLEAVAKAIGSAA